MTKVEATTSLFLPIRIVRDRLPSSILYALWNQQTPHSVVNSTKLIEGQRPVAAGLGHAAWQDFYEVEAQRSPVDMGLVAKPSEVIRGRVFGQLQPSVPLDHRSAILRWMCDTCQASHWSHATFFTACHAFDCYVLKCTHFIAASSLGPISAACLYYAAHLRESSADGNIMTLDRFYTLCPEVGSAARVRETESHLLETIQGISLGHRAPSDLIVLWLASLLNHEELGSSFAQLQAVGVMQFMLDILLNLSIFCYMNGLCLISRGSTWVAAALAALILAVQDGVSGARFSTGKENLRAPMSQALQPLTVLPASTVLDIISTDVDLSLSRRYSGAVPVH